MIAAALPSGTACVPWKTPSVVSRTVTESDVA
jgi:hypothetical protein